MKRMWRVQENWTQASMCCFYDLAFPAILCKRCHHQHIILNLCRGWEEIKAVVINRYKTLGGLWWKQAENQFQGHWFSSSSSAPILLSTACTAAVPHSRLAFKHFSSASFNRDPLPHTVKCSRSRHFWLKDSRWWFLLFITSGTGRGSREREKAYERGKILEASYACWLLHHYGCSFWM